MLPSRSEPTFLKDARGTVSAIFALSLICVMLLIGLAVDVSRAYDAESRVQTALDAAALAGARMFVDDSIDLAEVESRTKAYFTSRITSYKIPGLKVSQPKVVSDQSQGTVEVTVDVSIPTYFGRITNVKPHFDFSPSSKAIYKAKKVELAMVVDITGSMCTTPPASTACSSAPKLDGLKTAAHSLIKALRNTTPEKGLIRVSLVPYSAAVNVGSYQNDVTGSSWAKDNCVIEREGSRAFSDDAPSPGSFIGSPELIVAALQSRYFCPPSELVPLSDISDDTARAQLEAGIDGLQAIGATAGHIGLSWGWYTISNKWGSIWPTLSKPGTASKDNQITKAIVLMTDGEFNLAYLNGGNLNIMPSPAALDAKIDGTSANQALKLCDEIKAQKVKIFSIAFLSPPKAEETLRACADGSGGAYYSSDDVSQLVAAFNDIAGRLTNLALNE